MTDNLWKPDKASRAAITRGNRKFKEWTEENARRISKIRAERRAAEQLDLEEVRRQREWL